MTILKIARVDDSLALVLPPEIVQRPTPAVRQLIKTLKQVQVAYLLALILPQETVKGARLENATFVRVELDHAHPETVTITPISPDQKAGLNVAAKKVPGRPR
jgi:hypothetical protein